jgi:DNA polymerase sigma
MYPYSEAVLFGSNAVGLSLPTSDIDIMLLDLNFSTREELCDYLAHIEVFINSMGWITSCSSYLNAKVPLLKLEIDTSINYLTPKIKLDYHQTYDPYLSRFLDLKDPSKAAVIKVDIIISTDAYRASPSTELMRNWLY